MHIVQVANFYSPTSGGLRTTLDALREGYLGAGHDVTLVVPGAQDTDADDHLGRRITIRGPRIPGGYRCILRTDRLRAVLQELRPDTIEVSDKLLVVAAADVAARHDIPVVLFSHERLDGILAGRVPSRTLLVAGTDRWNRHIAQLATRIVCASDYAAQEFTRVGVPVTRVALGVDLHTFRPSAAVGPTSPPTVVYSGRLSREKRPEVVVDACRFLHELGQPLQLVVAGSGPMADDLLRRAGRLPIQLRGHLPDRSEMAALLASASVVAAPCPVETFGLSVLEALACGTPVVVSDGGGAQELLAPGTGWVARATTTGLAEGIRQMLAAPSDVVRGAARRRACRFPWSATVDRMLAVHGARARAAA